MATTGTTAAGGTANGTGGNGPSGAPVKRFSIDKDEHDPQRVAVYEHPVNGPRRVVCYVHDPRISRELVDAANAAAGS